MGGRPTTSPPWSSTAGVRRDWRQIGRSGSALRISARLVLAVTPKAPLPKARSDLEAGFESFEANGDAFGLGVFMDGFSAVLATDSAHLVAAERNLGLIAVRVDEDVARLQRIGDFGALPNIVRPDI